MLVNLLEQASVCTRQEHSFRCWLTLGLGDQPLFRKIHLDNELWIQQDYIRAWSEAKPCLLDTPACVLVDLRKVLVRFSKYGPFDKIEEYHNQLAGHFKVVRTQLSAYFPDFLSSFSPGVLMLQQLDRKLKIKCIFPPSYMGIETSLSPFGFEKGIIIQKNIRRVEISPTISTEAIMGIINHLTLDPVDPTAHSPKPEPSSFFQTCPL